MTCFFNYEFILINYKALLKKKYYINTIVTCNTHQGLNLNVNLE